MIYMVVIIFALWRRSIYPAKLSRNCLHTNNLFPQWLSLDHVKWGKLRWYDLSEISSLLPRFTWIWNGPGT